MACSRLSNRRLKKHELTVQLWIPLTALWSQSPVSETELAGDCHMSASSMNRLMVRMEAKMLVRRKKGPNDQRRALVELEGSVTPPARIPRTQLEVQAGQSLDCPHNKQLLNQMPNIFSAPGVSGRRRRMSFRWCRLFSFSGVGAGEGCRLPTT